jgi:peptidoglycan/xylan/chitin deacetylase (PgdA/CDA1 family)
MRRVRTTRKEIYITFDDGPIPELTPWVLDTLKAHGARATFFCIGQNIERNPGIFERIKAEGHGVGNHTHHHLKGWDTGRFAYLRDTLRCQRFTRTGLFRPPYGRITLAQARALARRFKLVFWDVLSEDFDVRLEPHHILSSVIQRTRRGSIVVFHDNLLSEERMRYVFPRVLEHFGGRGYRFPVLPGSTTG